MHDRLNATSRTAAGILLPHAVGDILSARGIYHARCTGPRGQDMPRYARLRDQLRELNGRSLVSRFWNKKLIERMQAEFDDIEVEEKWKDTAPNTVMTLGKNLILDQALAGSAYTVTGPYMGLISSVSYSAIAAADTMASHAGWTEAGSTNAPTYTAPRKTMAWSAASGGSKSLSAALSFSMTGAGTLKGAFMVLGSGASSTIENTGGTLCSAGLFTGGDQPVVNTNTVAVSYSLAL